MPGLPCNPRLFHRPTQQSTGSPLRLRGRLLQHLYLARLVFCCAHHCGFGDVAEPRLVLCLFSLTSDRGSAIPTQGHPTSRSSRQCVFGSPRVSLREGARRAGDHPFDVDLFLVLDRRFLLSCRAVRTFVVVVSFLFKGPQVNEVASDSQNGGFAPPGFYY